MHDTKHALLASDIRSSENCKMKEVAKANNVRKGGTKAELIVRLLDSFGLKQPTCVPMEVCVAVRCAIQVQQPLSLLYVGDHRGSSICGCQLLRVGVKCPKFVLISRNERTDSAGLRMSKTARLLQILQPSEPYNLCRAHKIRLAIEEV